MPKSFGFVLIVFLLFIETLKHEWSVAGGLSSSLCLENERQALLDFKEDIVDPSNRLSSWFGQDCCMWNGVGCNNQTGHVIKLDLRNPVTLLDDIYTGVQEVKPSLLELKYLKYSKACLHVQEVKPSLLELKHLKYLDLSWNNFSGISIPKFFGSFQELTYLNLSSAWFGGHVPHHIGNLSALRSLDLSTHDLLWDQPQLIVDTFSWTTHLTSLKKFDMSQINLSNIKDPIFPSLSSLLELHLSMCRLKAILLHNLTSLVVLNLSYNDLTVPLQSVISNNTTSLTSLKVLILSGNNFSYDGQLPNLENLEMLDLSDGCFYWDDETLDMSTNLENLESFGKFLPPSLRVSLETLDMSTNELNGSLPSWLYRFKNLKNLDLSHNFFSGPIPAYFGAMRNLKLLDLRFNDGLSGQIPTFLANLSALEVLGLGDNNFTGPIPTSLGELSALRILDLSVNQLSGQIPVSFNRLSNLNELYLHDNHLSGQIPMYLGRMITVLNLCNNQLNGQIPISLGNMLNLRLLDLSSNSLSGPLPISFGSLSKLKEIKLFNNYFNGVVTEMHFATLSRLELLDLSSSFFSLEIQSGWIPPFQLTVIKLASCHMGPHFPDWLRTQTTMVELDISNASISDSIPKWFDNLSPDLSVLDLSHNQIHGHVPKFSNTANPASFYLGSNKFEGPLPDFPKFLSVLDLSNNNISGPIPNIVGDRLAYLGLSRNRLNGSIPKWLCNVSLFYLDISNNQLSGDLPQCWGNSSDLWSIDFSSNKLSGTIPSSLCNMPLSKLLLSKNNFHGKVPSGFRNCSGLSILDLGENKLSGKVPNWIVSNFSLKVLRLRSNRFRGSISPRLCNHLNNLQILDLANNNISGKIPYCLGNFSGMVLNKVDEGDFGPQDITPFNIDGDIHLDKVIQVIKGREDEYFNSQLLGLLTNLDLSHNNLVGNIPKELINLDGLINLNLSKNHLTGDIPKMIGQMKSLQSLDFSKNDLSGTIPQSISSLTFLTVLNLSYNNLSGPIPTGSQLQTLEDPSIYIGNTELCGYPLEKCIGNEPPQSPTTVDQKGEADEDEFNMKWFYIGMGSGCVAGFWGFCGVLLFMKTWRRAYFRFFDDIIERLYVAILIRINRLKHREVEE